MDPANTDTPQTPASEQPPVPPTGPLLQWKKIFLSEHGLRAGWRIILYIFLVVFSAFAITFLFRTFYHGPRTGAPSASLLFLQESASFAIAFLPAWFMAWLERRPVGDYGLPLRSAFGGHFWKGCALGIAEIGVLMGLIAAFHGYSFGPLNLNGAAIYRWAIFWLFFFILVGLFEEFFFRGYLQWNRFLAGCLDSLGHIRRLASPEWRRELGRSSWRGHDCPDFCFYSAPHWQSMVRGGLACRF